MLYSTVECQKILSKSYNWVLRRINTLNIYVHKIPRPGFGSQMMFAIDKEGLDKLIKEKEYQEKTGKKRLSNQWARRFKCCLECGSIEYEHRGRGICKKCYDKVYMPLYRERNIVKIKQQKKIWHERDKKENPEKYSKKRNQQYFSGNRNIVLNRDNYTCQLCGVQGDFVVHHIDGNSSRNSDNPNNDIDNLITLCKRCHLHVHWHTTYSGHPERNLIIADAFNEFITSKLKDIVQTKQRCLEIDRNDQSTDNSQE